VTSAHVLAYAIAEHLPGWTVRLREDCEWCDLIRSDGAAICVQVGGFRNEGRVTFRGLHPKFKDGRTYSGGEYVNITCSATREPKAIAKEIQRRLLPRYDHVYATALAYVTSHDERGEEAHAVASRLASIIGGTVGENKMLRGDGVRVFGEPESVHRILVQPAYSSSSGDWGHPVRVDFEVHGLDPETASQVLQLIRESEARKSAAVARTRVSEPATMEEEFTNEDFSELEEVSTPRRVG
jgi:hypothetical protein